MIVHSDAKGVSVPTGLIERLEAAAVGSRELDALIGLWELRAYGQTEVWLDGDSPRYTTSLDAALALAERVLPGWFVGVQPWFHTDPDRVMHRSYVIRPDWSRWNPVNDDWFESHSGPSAATPALAACIAILKATTASAVGMERASAECSQPGSPSEPRKAEESNGGGHG